MLLAAIGLAAAPAAAQHPQVRLGPADELALDQPRVAVQLVEPDTGRILGPTLANTFLLDTGANSILAVDDAVAELNKAGYRTEGTFFERGVAGATPFDVSAEYDVHFAGSDGSGGILPRARMMSSNTVSFCPVPGLCSFFGIMGMPAMNGRVTTLDVSSIAGDGGGGGAVNIDDLFNSLLNFDLMATSFSDSLPNTTRRRVSIPVQRGRFDPEGEDPLPTWIDLPMLSAAAVNGANQQRGNFVLDTGAQLSILSSAMAFDVGMDTNGNGTLDDEAVGFQPIGGVGGTINAPLMFVDELRVPTDQGFDLVYTDLKVAIVDIDPTIDGIFGMNLLTSGWTGSLFGNLDGLGDLLDDAGLADLFKEFGGIGLGGGEGAPFGYYDNVHLDFRKFEQGQGRIVIDLMPEVSDIVAADGLHGDLDGDFDVDLDDRRIWVTEVQQTQFGDANLDGVFNSKDLIQVFQAGEYEDRLPDNSTWATGDWNADWEFNSRDMVLAFQEGDFQRAARAPLVPEPSTSTLVVLALGIVALQRRTRTAMPQ